MFFILGFAIFLATIGFVITILGGDIRFFLNLPTIIFIFIPLTGVLTATNSFKVFYGGLKAVIFPKEPISDELRGQAASLFRFLSKATIMIAVIMTLISLVNMLFSMDFADSNAIYCIGINIAASLISMLYAMILIVGIFEPVVFILKKRQATKERK